MAASRSPEENEFLARMASDAGLGDIWSACNDRMTEGTWSCQTNGSAYISWLPGEPNNLGDEDCAIIVSHSASWNDIKCGLARHAVCIQKSRKVLYRHPSNQGN